MIRKVETSLDVNSLLYKGLRIWPLLRSNLITMLERPEYEPARQKVCGDLSCQSLVADSRQLAGLEGLRGTEFMFLSRCEEHNVQISGEYYNPWLDPYIEAIRDAHSCVKVEMLTAEAERTSPRSISTVFLGATEGSFQIPDPAGCIAGFEELQSLVQSMCSVELDIGRTVVSANTANQYRLFYLDILSAIQPKVVALVCYYGVPAMGLIWACRDMNITSIDLQHGYHCGHLYYEDWWCPPPDGYELLPDLFHVWSDSCKADIEKPQPAECIRHKAVVGNNAWMRKAVCREIAAERIDGVDLDFLDSLERQEKVMLVTLQPLPDPLPEHLLEAVKSLPDDWLWLMRCHPGHLDRKAEAIRLMDGNGITNYEIENSTTCPLFLLLERCDHHLTAISSVCLEALLFGVPTTFFCQEAYDRYGRHIDAGFFNCVPSSVEDMVRFLSFDYDKARVRAIGDYFFNMSEEVGREAFEKILEYSQGREFRPVRENLRAIHCNQAGLEFAGHNDWEKALHSFWNATRAEPKSTEYLNNLAAACSSLGRGDDAAKCIAAALRIDPDDSRSINNYHELIRAGIHVELPTCSVQSSSGTAAE